MAIKEVESPIQNEIDDETLAQMAALSKMQVDCIELGDVIHVCADENYCCAAHVSGIPSSYGSVIDVDADGRPLTATGLFVHVSYPKPRTPPICNDAMLNHHTPKNQNDKPMLSWHTVVECRMVGGSKRMRESNILMPGRLTKIVQ